MTASSVPEGKLPAANDPLPMEGAFPFDRETASGPVCTQACRWHWPLRFAGLVVIAGMAGAYAAFTHSPELAAMIPDAALDWMPEAHTPHVCRNNFCSHHDESALPPADPSPEMASAVDGARSDGPALPRP